MIIIDKEGKTEKLLGAVDEATLDRLLTEATT